MRRMAKPMMSKITIIKKVISGASSVSLIVLASFIAIKPINTVKNKKPSIRLISIDTIQFQ